jgi:hypothetical protein
LGGGVEDGDGKDCGGKDGGDENRSGDGGKDANGAPSLLAVEKSSATWPMRLPLLFSSHACAV